VIEKALAALSDYGWIGLLLWGFLGLICAGLACVGFFVLGFAGIAAPRALYWSSWLFLLIFPTYLFATLRIGVAWLGHRRERID
jgi:hypothetical protein